MRRGESENRICSHCCQARLIMLQCAKFAAQFRFANTLVHEFAVGRVTSSVQLSETATNSVPGSYIRGSCGSFGK
jgi:hypothetical protein